MRMILELLKALQINNQTRTQIKNLEEALIKNARISNPTLLLLLVRFSIQQTKEL